MYIARSIRPAFAEAVAHFPAVLVTGPRQSGKTTFVRRTAGDAAYVSLDDPQERIFAAQDPNGFLERFTEQRLTLQRNLLLVGHSQFSLSMG